MKPKVLLTENKYPAILLMAILLPVLLLLLNRSFAQSVNAKAESKVHLKLKMITSDQTISIDTAFDRSEMENIKEHYRALYPNLELFDENTKDDIRIDLDGNIHNESKDVVRETVVEIDLKEMEEDVKELKEISVVITTDSGIKDSHQCTMKLLEEGDFENLDIDGDAKIVIKKLKEVETDSDGNDQKEVKVETKRESKVVVITDRLSSNPDVDVDSLVGGMPSDLSVMSFNLYPNPSEGRFVVTFVLEDKSPVTIHVTDISGKVVFEEGVKKFSGKYSANIDLGKNTKGVYFLSVMQNGKKFTKKFMIE
jgi:hypothetical protein